MHNIVMMMMIYRRESAVMLCA